MERFAERLRTLRREHSLSQRSISGRIGISQGHYAKLEKSSRDVSREIVDRLADLYSRSGSELVRGTDHAVKYARKLNAPQRDEMLRDHVATEVAAARENIRAGIMYLRIVRNAYRELLALFAAQHEGLLYVETDRALRLFTFSRQYIEKLPNLGLLEEQVGEIYLPEAIFEGSVPEECRGEEYDYVIKPKLVDSMHRLDAYATAYELSVPPDIVESLANFEITSLQPAIEELVAFRQAEERKFFRKAEGATKHLRTED